MPERQCFVTDECGHWYLIDVKDMELFNEMLADKDDEDCEKFDDRFTKNLLQMHISNYSFIDCR